MPAKDNYARNNLLNHGVKVEYEKEDLPQVNHQLHEWLATVNERSSKDSIPQKTDLSTGLEKKTVTRTNSEKMHDTDKRDLAPRKEDAMIKKIFRFLRASVSYLKDKDKATADEVRDLVLRF